MTTLQDRVQQLIAAAPGKITVASGTRTYAEQERLYNLYLAGQGNLAAKPGTSKHETGQADDLAFSSPTVKQWAHDNAARFGLVFPVKGEDWHVEATSVAGYSPNQDGTYKIPSLPGDPTAAYGTSPVTLHRALAEVGVELLAVAGLALLAGQGRRGGHVALLIIVTLWIVAAIVHYSGS